LLIIAGPDELGHRAELEQLVEQLGIANWVRFVGPIFGPAKRDAFAAAEVFVLPSRTEGFGIAVAEALGAGVPVITTHGAPWPELETEQCGWWVPIDSAAMADALCGAVRLSAAELGAMGQRGQALISRRYTWSIVAQQSRQLYAWLLGSGDRPDFVTLV
jgi:glycosyltransferase involved in cell wall biosynthesis